MRYTKTLAAAAVVAMAGTTASAGGIEPTPPLPPIEVIPPAAAPTSSVPAGYIVLGLVAALVAASGSF